jgi:hypothetical protein
MLETCDLCINSKNIIIFNMQIKYYYFITSIKIFFTYCFFLLKITVIDYNSMTINFEKMIIMVHFSFI